MPADTPAPAPAPASLAPFGVPIFRDIWIANLVSNFGGLIQGVGAAWMMTGLAGSADMVALVQASNTLPIMLLSLAAGALADNWNRRRQMLYAQTFMLLVSAALAGVTWAGWLGPWGLLAFTFLIGCGTAFNNPAWQSSVGEMVPRPLLPQAVSLNSVSFNIARSLGPALGGLIVAAAGAAAAFAVNALSYAGLLVVLLRWKSVEAPRPLPPEPLVSAMGAGLRYLAMSPDLLRVLARAAVFGFGANAIPALMPLVARDLVAGSATTYGLLLGAFGVGAIGGAVGGAALRSRLSNEATVRLGFIGFGVAAIGVGASPYLPLTLMLLLLGGAAWVVTLSTFNVTVQLSAPRWVVGRAVALYQMATFGGMAAGAWGWGALGAAEGLGIALTVAGLVQFGGAALGFVLPVARATSINLDPLRLWKEPRVALPIEPRSGPIVVTVTYAIADEDVLAFLSLMGERRRVRLRDGARNWHLLRDLHRPQQWTERFHAPTWLDYVRQNDRITQADASVGERLRALHQGAEPPLVSRLIERQVASVPFGSRAVESDAREGMTDASAA